MTLSKKNNTKPGSPLLRIGIGVLVVGAVWYGISEFNQSQTRTTEATDEVSASARDIYNELYQLRWRSTDQVGNISVESTLFDADLRQALMAMTEVSDHQQAMQRALEAIDDTATVFYVLVAQPASFIGELELSEQATLLAGGEILAATSWQKLEPLWLGQAQYFQRDGFLIFPQTDIANVSAQLVINYPDLTKHAFAWPAY